MSELQLKLEDFLPAYPHFKREFNDDDIFNVYDENTETVIYKKQEFKKNKLSSLEMRSPEVGVPLKHQSFISRFLSRRTLYDQMLLFHQVGTGKCILGNSIININKTDVTIEDIWKLYSNKIIIDEESNEWSTPTEVLITKSLQEDKRTIVDSVIKNLYRQYVNEDIYEIQLKDKKISCTGKHKFYSEGQWVPASFLKRNQNISRIEKISDYTHVIINSNIINITKRNYSGYVYDLEIYDTHNYIANGILTHNTCTSIMTTELSRMIDKTRKTLVLVKGEGIERNFNKELAFKCTQGQYIPDNYNSLTEGKKVTRLNKNIRKNYKISSFEIFAKDLSKMNEEEIIRQYSNMDIRKHLVLIFIVHFINFYI